MKLLIIEDEQELADSIISYLAGNGFVCEKANSVSMAIDKISNYEYDCILLDLMIWDEDGFEIFIGDQSNPDFWKNLYDEIGKIDIKY